MTLLGQRPPQDDARTDHIDVLAVEPQQDPLPGKRLRPVANHGRRLGRSGQDERLTLDVDDALFARSRPRAALYAHVAADRKPFNGLPTGDGLGLPGPRLLRRLLPVLGDGVLARHVEIAAREADVPIEEHAPTLRLDAHVASVEIQRAGEESGRRQENDRAGHRRASICSCPTTPSVRRMEVPSVRASIPRPSTR